VRATLQRLGAIYLGSLLGVCWIPLVARWAHASWRGGAIFTAALPAGLVFVLALADLMAARPQIAPGLLRRKQPAALMDDELLRNATEQSRWGNLF
jgi:hypothetical protein